MNVITGYLSGKNIDFVFKGNLSQKIPHSNRYRPYHHALAVLRNPDHVNFHIRLCMGAELVTSSK